MEYMTAASNETTLVPFVIKQYDYILYDNEDPRFLELPLMASAFVILGPAMVYLFAVCFALPRYMTKKQPMKLQKTLMVYNAFQVLLNSWIVALCVQGGWFNGYSFMCQPSDFSRNPKAMRMVYACWWYLLAKYVDWLDTVFFVLRKSYGQVSFLHVYHHISTPFWAWYVVRFIGGGHWTLLIICNSFIHILMYTYYLLAGLGYHKYLWWKKYLTALQMGQFILLMVHEFQLYFIECNYPKFTRILALPLGVTILSLFYNFYRESYKRKSSKDIGISKMVYLYGKKMACLRT